MYKISNERTQHEQHNCHTNTQLNVKQYDEPTPTRTHTHTHTHAYYQKIYFAMVILLISMKVLGFYSNSAYNVTRCRFWHIM